MKIQISWAFHSFTRGSTFFSCSFTFTVFFHTAPVTCLSCEMDSINPHSCCILKCFWILIKQIHCVFRVFPALVEDLVKTSGRTLSQPQGVRWGSWETWSSCSQQCSRGFRTRKRSCSTAEGRTNPSACVGSPVEYQDCNTQPCPGNREVLTVNSVAIAE